MLLVRTTRTVSTGKMWHPIWWHHITAMTQRTLISERSSAISIGHLCNITCVCVCVCVCVNAWGTNVFWANQQLCHIKSFCIQKTSARKWAQVSSRYSPKLLLLFANIFSSRLWIHFYARDKIIPDKNVEWTETRQKLCCCNQDVNCVFFVPVYVLVKHPAENV